MRHASKQEYRETLKNIQKNYPIDTESTDKKINNMIENMKKNLHGGNHHMSDFDGALRCTVGQGTNKEENPYEHTRKKSESSYFLNNDDLKTALKTMLNPKERNNQNTRYIDILAGKLANLDIGEKTFLTIECPEYDDTPFGKTIVHDPHARRLEDQALFEMDAHNLMLVIKKTDNKGNFELYNAYPTVDINKEYNDPNYTPYTSDNDFRKKLLESQVFTEELNPLEQTYWMAQTYLDETSPKLTLKKANEKYPQQIVIEYDDVTNTKFYLDENHNITSSNPFSYGERTKQIIEQLGLTDKIESLHKALDMAPSSPKQQTRNIEPIPTTLQKLDTEYKNFMNIDY